MKIKVEWNQFDDFPGTRYMGSKNKIIHPIWNILSQYKFESIFDAFGGSNVVGYFMKTKGKVVVTNDFMSMSYFMSTAIIENDKEKISKEELEFLIGTPNSNSFIQNTFKDIYFSDEENNLLDQIRGNIDLIPNKYKKAIALSSLIRACVKKRPRGIFTYVGQRYDDGRKDISKSIKDHFIENVEILNQAVFDNGLNSRAFNNDIFDLEVECDLVYLDPPYYNPKGDNDYVRRYHFVEGLAKYWEGLEIQKNTITKKFKSYKSPFSTKKNVYDAFDSLIKRHKNSIIAISYSSNSLPSKNEMIDIIRRHKKSVIVHEIPHTYSFGNQSSKVGNLNNKVKEYLFIAK